MRGDTATAKVMPETEPIDGLERRIAGVAHELRTPLNGLLALADRLLETELANEQRQYVHAMRAAAHHLHAVATDVLDVARLQESQPRLSISAVDMKALFGEIGAPFTARAHAKGVTFSIDAAPDVPGQVMADPVRLRQMIENLIDNAIKVTDRGHVTMNVTATPDTLPDRTRLTFIVADTGPGFAVHETESLFLPFAQGTHSRGGAGLGLALVRGFAEAMDGQAFAANRPEGGASVGFTVSLERVAVREERSKTVTPAPASHGPLRILVAEDNHINRVVIGTILDQFGHHHDMVANGSAALAALTRGGYDLVLMDKNMPVLDGLSATRAIRALPGDKADIPVIGVTAGAFAHEIQEFHDAGAETVVTKPISVRALWQAIEEALATARRVA